MKQNRAMLWVLILASAFGLAPLEALAALVTWDETAQGGGDAGELTGTSQQVVGLGSDSLVTISGSLDTATDRDLYRINISTPGTYSFTVDSTADPSRDSVLALFNSSGIGVAYHDDISETVLTSLLDDSSALVTAPGDYYLAIIGVRQRFTSDDGFIWAVLTPWGVQKAPDGPGGASSLTGYDLVLGGPTVAFGDYTISITGGVTPVPESSFYGIAFAVMGLVVAGVRYRKSRETPAGRPTAN